MSLQTIEFDLQITPGSIPPVLHLAQYDSGRKFYANLKNGSAAFYPTAGSTAKIKGFNAAGVAWEQEATIFNNTVSFTPAGAATDQFGVMPVTIEITYDGETLTPLLVVFDIQRAGYTNEEAVRSPEFQTAIEAAVAAAIEEGNLGFSEDFKEALLACFAHVAWSDTHGQDYYDALEEALYPEPEPSTLVSINADYEQDRPIYDTDDLDAIKVSDDLTVTAHYSNGSSVVLDDDDYILSGTLTVGTSIITVSYDGKTTTISVLVSAGYETGYKTVGTPSISDNKLTPSANGYIRNETEFTPTGAWKMQFAVKTTQNANQNIFMTADANGDRVRSFQCQVIYATNNLQIAVYLSSNGTTWDISQGLVNIQNLSTNTEYLVEIGFNNPGYYIKWSTDNGATWTSGAGNSTATKIKGGGFLTFGTASGTTPVLSGEINLAKIKVWQDDSLWWVVVP